MERDLNFRKLFKMYILNLWLVILVGIVAAAGVGVVNESSSEVVFTKDVYLVFDLDSSAYKELETKKYTYTEAYRGLVKGNALDETDVFSNEERNRLSSRSLFVEHNCYTITLTLPDDGNIETDKAIFDKWIEESEKWMKDKFNDESIEVEQVSDKMAINGKGNNRIMMMILGFIVGAVLAAMALFVWFVLDKKIRDEEDVLYYTGVKCLGTVKRRK